MKNFTFIGRNKVCNKSYKPKLTQSLLATAISAALITSMGVVQAGEVLPDNCTLYGVNDISLSDSQFVKIGGTPLNPVPFGPLHEGYDIEGLDLCPNGTLYASSGDDVEEGKPAGHLYKVDRETGALTPVGPITFKTPGGQSVKEREVSAISCNPMDGTLWGWAEECGLLEINPTDGKAKMRFFATDEATCITPNPEEYTSYVEDLSWDPTGTVLYFPKNKEVWYYDIGSGLNPKKIGKVTELGDNVETSEILQNGNLLVGLHSSSDFAKLVLAPKTNETVTVSSTTNHRVKPNPYNDIEALTWSCPSIRVGPGSRCAEAQKWTYSKDTTGDGSGDAKLDIFGLAMREDGDTITVAINAGMGPRGAEFPGLGSVADRNVSFTDLVLDFVTKDANGNFTGSLKKYAVHFASGNDSNMVDLGLYKNITLKDVTSSNQGYDSLSSYAAHYPNSKLGDLPLQNSYFAPIYSKSRSIPLVVSTGTKVENDDFRLLSATELTDMGLNFATGFGMTASSLGKFTFGFTFKKQADMTGNFVAYVFTECINDGTAMVNTFPLPTTQACDM
jgi:hypothetical protein